MSSDRKNEKLGWLLGWSGGFIWVLILAIVSLAKGDFLNGFMGIILVITATVMIFALSPWHNPTQPYWKLILPIYLILFLSFTWLLWISKGAASLGLNVWSIFLIIPLLLPIFIIGKRRWIENEQKKT